MPEMVLRQSRLNWVRDRGVALMQCCGGDDMVNPRRSIKLERRWTDYLPPVTPADFIGLGSVDRPGRPSQLFLEKTAGIGRRIQEQHAGGFGAGVFPRMRYAARQEATGAGPADRYLVATLEGYFAAQQVGHLVAIAVKVECGIGAGRRGFCDGPGSLDGFRGGIIPTSSDS
jgi:hypothetical protein